MDTLPQHQCIIYDGFPSRLLQSLARTIIHELKSNHRCFYLNSPSMVTGMRSCLVAEGLNLEEEIGKGSLILTSEQTHLSNGRFEVNRMLDILRQNLQQALDDGYVGLWASGDMTWEFGGESNLDKLVEYERKLEAFMQKNPALRGVCQYHRASLPFHAVQAGLDCHRALYINETLSRLNPDYRVAG